jgi:tetratricopeptide (TPR) repeat protein
MGPLLDAIREAAETHASEGRPEASANEWWRLYTLAEGIFGEDDPKTRAAKANSMRARSERGEPGNPDYADMGSVMDAPGNGPLVTRASLKAAKAGLLLGYALLEDGKPADAVVPYAKAYEVLTASGGPETPDAAAAREGLAEALGLSGRHVEATGIRREILARAETLSGPGERAAREARQMLALELDASGKRREAVELFRREVSRAQKADGPSGRETTIATFRLARFLKTGKGFDAGTPEALPVNSEMKEAFDLLKGLLSGGFTVSPGDPDLVAEALEGQRALGDLLHWAGMPEEAESMRQRALAAARKGLGRKHPSVLGAMADLAESVMRKAPRQALQLAQGALVGRIKALGNFRRETLLASFRFGEALLSGGRVSEGISLMLVMAKALDKYPALRADAATARAVAAKELVGLGDAKGAAALLSRAVEGRKAALGADDPRTMALKDLLVQVRRAAKLPTA